MPQPANILLTGAGGQLGRALQACVPESIDLCPMDRTALDITDRQAVFEAFEAFQPAWIINAAAYTDVDGAESKRDLAFRVNADGAGFLAQAAETIGARMVQVSTDFVFDGRTSRPYKPDDVPNPINVYGESKLMGEQRARAVLGDDALIVRTAWLYAREGANFVHTMLRLMRERDTVQVVDDQIGTPTEAGKLAHAIWRSIRCELSGIHHWTDAGVASWYDFAVAIREEASFSGLSTCSVEIEPVPTSSYPTPAERPTCSVLDKQLTWEALEQRAEHWRAALRRVLRAKKISRSACLM